MQLLNNYTFNFFNNSKPSQLGIYFSLLLHLSILLFAIGLPDFFKPKKLTPPQIIPIEILNISDVTSLTSKNEIVQNDKDEIKKIKQKKFNSSENTEIQKIILQKKPKTKITKNKNIVDNNIKLQNLESKNITLKEKKIINSKEESMKLDSVETLKIKTIKPKLKPKPIKETQSNNDLKIQNNTKSVIKKNNVKNVIDKPKPIQKPDPDLNLATMLKDLRNEDNINVSDSDEKDKKIEDNELEKANENLEVSISEIDLVLQQLRGCFNPRAGTEFKGDEMIKISAKIDRQTYVRTDTVQIVDTNISKSNPYYEAITESALAIFYNPLCSKLKLPKDKYEEWKKLTINVDYSWMKN